MNSLVYCIAVSLQHVNVLASNDTSFIAVIPHVYSVHMDSDKRIVLGVHVATSSQVPFTSMCM